MKVYIGVNTEIGPQTITVRQTGATHDKEPYDLKHVERHSPDGFQWGYGGSGPADTALSILTDCVGKKIADKHYQDFKWEFIAKAGESLIIYELEIRAWLRERGAIDG